MCVCFEGKSSKPWREMASHVKETVRWRNSAESLVVFLVRGLLVFSLFLSFTYPNNFLILLPLTAEYQTS